MKVIFTANLPSPYRADFFNELGKYCELTVLFERQSSAERHQKWVGEPPKTYKAVFLDLKPVGVDRAKGNAMREYIKNARFDRLIFTDYVSPATMRAILYCRRHHIPYQMEYDGGFYKKDKLPQKIIKKVLLGGAWLHLTTCDEHIRYLISLGIPKEKIRKYPFTSVRQAEIDGFTPLSPEKKQVLRHSLGMTESKILLSVGQFVPRKGYDILLGAAKDLPADVGIYIVGGQPTEEYLAMQKEYGLDRLHFVGFKTKTELKDYYAAADVFVLPTREDIWGLVVNEAFVYGVPVVTTDRCVAGLELIRQNETGSIVPTEDRAALAGAVNEWLARTDTDDIADRTKRTALAYTIEQMAKRHLEILSGEK